MGCYKQATRVCRGGHYQIQDSESHTGGSVTWYSMTFTCGPSDGRLATFPWAPPDLYIPPNPSVMRADWKHGHLPVNTNGFPNLEHGILCG